MKRLMFFLSAPLAVASLLGCDAGKDVDTSRASEFGFQTSVRTSLIEEGRVAYGNYCAGCHGENGDGNGVAARFLAPRPRNFQIAHFKFSSTRSGQLPTDQDLERTITEGLKGSAMPGWDLLPNRTVTALIAYIKTFSPKWTERVPAPAIPQVTDPYRSAPDKSKAIARGEAVYHGFASCWSCHPAYVSEERINEYRAGMESAPSAGFRPNLREGDGKPNVEGEMVYPPDFMRDFVRSGADVTDLYRTIAAGISGTAMPTWVDSMEIPSADGSRTLVEPADLWAMAYYVQSLVLQRPTKLTENAYAVRRRPQTIYKPGERPAVITEQPADEGGEFLEDAEEFEEE